MKSIIQLNILLLLVCTAFASGQDGIPISDIKRSNDVDFDKEILPMLRQNCLACHNSTDAEGDVILESVAKILESESVVAGKPAESSLLTLAAHQDDPVMPPEDNEVKAKNLTSDQLGLLKLWIAQGAKPSASNSANKVEFAALPAGVNPVYALAMSPNGKFLAAGRANQIFVYNVPGKRLVDRVTDPALVKASPYKQRGIAHLDIVQSLVFSPDNQTFVSGGFRNVKIWRRQPNAKVSAALDLKQPISVVAKSNQNRWLVIGSAQGQISTVEIAGKTKLKTIQAGDKAIDAIAVQEDGQQYALVTEKRKLKIVDSAGKPLGNELTLEQDATGVVFVNKNSKLVVSLANNTMALIPVSSFQQDAKENPKPERVLTGHSKPVTHLMPYGADDSKLLTASADGTAKIWNLSNGQQVRTFSHGGPINAVEISADESRVATCGANGSLKIFNATNSALVKEVKGDASVEYQVALNDREVRLKQQLIDVAKRDVDAANKEKTAEEANVKKTEEALKKADEELKRNWMPKTRLTWISRMPTNPSKQNGQNWWPCRKPQRHWNPN